MAIDISVWGERCNADGVFVYVDVRDALGSRNNRVFAFLAGVCNADKVEPISNPRGLPEDASRYVRFEMLRQVRAGMVLHAMSWLDLTELTEFDYDAPVERCDGATRSGEEGGSWRDYLGERYFEGLAVLKQAHVDRIVFDFDF